MATEVKVVSIEPAKDASGVHMAANDRMSVDAKVVNCVVSFCVLLGLVLVVAGAVVYNQIRTDHTCSSDGGFSCEDYGEKDCDCLCTRSINNNYPDSEQEERCDDYDREGGSTAAAISIAACGAVVCVLSAAMLVTMRWCKEWSEKNLHVRYPPVSPEAANDETI